MRQLYAGLVLEVMFLAHASVLINIFEIRFLIVGAAGRGAELMPCGAFFSVVLKCVSLKSC